MVKKQKQKHSIHLWGKMFPAKPNRKVDFVANSISSEGMRQGCSAFTSYVVTLRLFTHCPKIVSFS